MRVQEGNPHQLTRKQHIIPEFLIKNFVGEDRNVEIYEKQSKKRLRRYPSNEYFYTYDNWNQQAESVVFGDIDNKFATIVKKVESNKNYSFSEEENETISEMFASWHIRQHYSKNEIPEQYAEGVLDLSHEYTQDEREQLEKANIVSMEKDENGKIFLPKHHVKGGIAMLQIIKFKKQLDKNIEWGILKSKNLEFIVPNNPVNNIMTLDTKRYIPIFPNMVLAYNEKNKEIKDYKVKEINKQFQFNCDKFYFARDLNNTGI